MAHLRPAGKHSGRASWRAAIAILFLAFLARSAPAGAPLDKEHQVKAVFLFNFTQFVEWPADAFPAKDSPLVVGILGPDPFRTFLDEVVRDEKVDSHPILVKRFGRVEDVVECHILFVGGLDPEETEKAIAALKQKKILTVSDSEDFSKRGGMINFVTRKGKIRLQINMDAVRAADLSLSSKLLRLAEILPPAKG